RPVETVVVSVLVLDQFRPADAARRREVDDQGGATALSTVADRSETITVALMGQQKREELRRERRGIGAGGAIRLVTLARLATVDALDLPRHSCLERAVDLDAQL